jgi:CRISPR-associated protein Cas5h
MQDIVVFDLVGPMAHFRKFYTNSSSLSYAFPPRTALMGIVAAILGWERDSYYDLLSPVKARLAAAIKAPVRKTIQTVNYIRTTNINEVNGSGGGTQIPMEILLPAQEFTSLRYRVYFYHADKEITGKLAASLEEGKSRYPLYLGLSEFIAKPILVDLVSEKSIQEVQPGREVEVVTVCNAQAIERLNFTGEGGDLQYIREKAPQSFGPGRELRPPVSIIYEKNQKKMRGIFKVPVYSLRYRAGEEEVVSFLEV